MQNQLTKNFVKYVSLSVLSMLGLSAYLLADTFFIAGGVGPSGLTALNLVLPAYMLLNGLGLMLGTGSATRYAVYREQNNSKMADTVFWNAMLTALVLGLLFAACGHLFSSPAVHLLGASAEVFPLSKTYFMTILSFSPMFLMNNVAIAFVRNDGNPRLASIAMLTGSFSNIMLDYILIFPLKLGMFGAALATGIAPVISLCILSTHIFGRCTPLRLSKSRVRPALVISCASLGVQSLITELSSGIVMLIFNFTILSLAGDIGVAAYGVVANLVLIATSVFTGIAQGAQPLLSAEYGKGNIPNTAKALRLAALCAVLCGAAFCLTGLVFPEPIAAVFNSENHVQLAAIAVSGIRIYFSAFLFMGVNIVCASFFAAVLRPLPAFLISILRGAVLVIILSLILPRVWGMTGVWLAVPLTESLTLLASLFFARRHFQTARNDAATDTRVQASAL